MSFDGSVVASTAYSPVRQRCTTEASLVVNPSQNASKYILGPLYDPEPSQISATRIKPLPMPPTSASPTRSFFSFSRRKGSTDNDTEDQPNLRRILSRSNSVNNHSIRSPPASPPRLPRNSPITDLERKRSLHTAHPPQSRWNTGTILARANSVASSRPSVQTTSAREDMGRRRAGSLAERYPGDKSHRPLETLTQEHIARDQGSDSLPRRGGSLRERFPGDMSHRPLAMIKREHRAADHAPHLRTHRRQQPSDTIDNLDHTGPLPEAVYHHGGPFDPIMESRNTNKKYSPVEAVKETNLEALKATPAEYLKDSLTKHVPLQGVAVVPPGMSDMSGRTMEYQEGADLMRESDAAGGAYKRWDHVPYLDGDLKGKGEPSYTVERQLKEQKALLRKQVPLPNSHANGMEYEMQPQTVSNQHSTDPKSNGTQVRHRSISNAADEPGSSSRVEYNAYGGYTDIDSGVQRSHSTGKNIAQTLKKRFGSLRRKKASDEERYY
ncbi:hypothetical protein B0H63DRAFT_26577 [Podospora didyma]|uniref:Pal1 cell morphology protein n=1 Tax=Podospora didyma TaxID=330526 RepID=A0AAE0U7E7_9PEZI|nr:hypothetical protein B0H63DRAFT_26577 [Podospora didyma]